MNIIVRRGPLVRLIDVEGTAIDAYYRNVTQFRQQPPHTPSPIELTALERELQEINAYCLLRAQQYRLSLGLTSQLLTIAQDARQALEPLGVLLSESRDRMERR